jgi:hypothetical protein
LGLACTNLSFARTALNRKFDLSTRRAEYRGPELFRGAPHQQLPVQTEQDVALRMPARAGTRNEHRREMSEPAEARERDMRAQARFGHSRVFGFACALRAGGRAAVPVGCARPAQLKPPTNPHREQSVRGRAADTRHRTAASGTRVGPTCVATRSGGTAPAPPGTTSIMCSVPSIVLSRTSPTPAVAFTSRTSRWLCSRVCLTSLFTALHCSPCNAACSGVSTMYLAISRARAGKRHPSAPQGPERGPVLVGSFHRVLLRRQKVPRQSSVRPCGSRADVQSKTNLIFLLRSGFLLGPVWEMLKSEIIKEMFLTGTKLTESKCGIRKFGIRILRSEYKSSELRISIKSTFVHVVLLQKPKCRQVVQELTESKFGIPNFVIPSVQL